MFPTGIDHLREMLTQAAGTDFRFRQDGLFGEIRLKDCIAFLCHSPQRRDRRRQLRQPSVSG